MIALVCVTVGMLLAVTIWAVHRTATSPGRGPQFDPDPTVWRVQKGMQDRLPPNCYTWALDRPELLHQEPGEVGLRRGDENVERIQHQRSEVTGAPLTPEKLDRYRAWARARFERDGLLDTAKHPDSPSPDAWLVVLYIDASERYHFVRHDQSGLWSHKQGALGPRRLLSAPRTLGVDGTNIEYRIDTFWWADPARVSSTTPHPVLPGSHTEYFLREYA